METAQHGNAAHSHGAGVPLQIRSDRTRSDRIEDFPALSQRDEQWRYLATDRLKALAAGEYSEFTGDLTLKAGTEVTTSWLPKGTAPFGSVGLPEDRVSAEAWNAVDAAYYLKVKATDSNSQVHLTVDSHDEEASALHIIVEAEKFANATVVIDHRGTAQLAENIEVIAGDEAKLTVVSIQDWADDSVHISSHFISVGRGATVKHIVISLGGKTVRITPSVRYAGPGGEAHLYGMYFADSGQYLEHRPFIDHSEPNCVSRVTYKGALQGEKAHTVWVGDVLIRAAAEGTDTYELNRNLLLTDGARADSVPNLEIETGKIEGAGHASASGRFDDEQLFYLQARGIDELQARRLVVYGFLNEVIQQIGVDEVENRISAAIEAELEKSNN